MIILLAVNINRIRKIKTNLAWTILLTKKYSGYYLNDEEIKMDKLVCF